ncbi:thioredoxin family protein [Tenacibaculum jejuense]|uniref:Thioredoxin n=1 Tax=Tenacibaculum jejuense TaxID=584609 RepID=A0A238UDN3_9FLAO|nr:thioredoxin domain-containing protein [Tenacibaculum jejuense]SNR17313.1 Thioredoxin family protein [Tenacibaculum jejuense]
MILEITDSSFEVQVLDSKKTAVVCFWSTKSKPSTITRSIIEEISIEYDSKTVFGCINIDENKEQASKYGIKNIPAVLIFKNGKLFVRSVGVVPKKTYIEDIQTLL